MGNDNEEYGNSAQTIDTVNTFTHPSAFMRVLGLECSSPFEY